MVKPLSAFTESLSSKGRSRNSLRSVISLSEILPVYSILIKEMCPSRRNSSKSFKSCVILVTAK